MQRRLSFTDGTSDKFWHIEQAGDTVTVRYGRRGTAGQTKTKQYASEAVAAADAEKQVAAKLRKGYTDDASAGSQVVAAATSADDPSQPTAREDGRAAQPVVQQLTDASAPEGQTPAFATPADPTHEGDPQDLGLVVFWHELGSDLTRQIEEVRDERPFDPDEELHRARRIVAWRMDGQRVRGWEFSESPFEGIPSPERAAWWLAYLSDGSNADLPADAPTWRRDAVRPAGALAVVLRQIAGEDLLDGEVAALDSGDERPTQGLHGHDGAAQGLEWLGLRLIWSHVDERRRAELARAVDARWWLHGDVTEVERTRLPYFSLVLGTHEEDIRRLVDSLEDGHLHPGFVADGQALCLLAPTSAERVALLRRLRGQVAQSAAMTLAWLQNTGAQGVPTLVEQLEGLGKDEARPGLDILTTRLRGPGAVQVFARLLGGRHASTALEWLNAHRGLVYAATLSARDAAPLALVLRAATVEELRAHVGHTTEGVRAVIDEILAEQDLAPFDPATPWWAQAAQGITVARLPKGLVETLPPVVVEEGLRLADAEVQVLLTALMTADRDHPLLVAFRDRAPATVRDRFTIALLDTWLARGAAGKEQWLMVGSGCIAGDGFVHHLTPMVREWPGIAQHQRAVQGLAALRNVGSDVALQAIAGVASKVKFAAIKKRAGEEMEQIASTLGLTRPQLEDRIIPDGGLDERGTREFSFGARRFLASVTPEGKVIVRPLGADGRPTGKPRTALPAPNQSDDPRQAAEAKDEFKVLKKTVTDIAKIQRLRFEQAMVAGRRWSADEFQEYVAPHPLLRGLLKSVIWGVLDGEARVALGRLDEDGALVDVDDAPIDVTGRSLCIVHPVDLSDDEIARWSEVQADYELAEAFPQLSRQRFALPAEQGDDLCLAGVPSGGIDPGRLVGACTKHGWQRGAALDAGVYRLFGQYFVAGDVTAVIQFEGGLWMGPMSEQEEQTLSAVYLLRGEFDPQNLDYGADPRFASPTFLGPIEHVPWSQAPRAVVSEVLATINAIAG